MKHDQHLKKILAVLDEQNIDDSLLFGDLDKKNDDLKPIIGAFNNGDTEQACRLLAEHFRSREKPTWIYDARRKPIEVARHFFEPYDWAEDGDESLVENIMNNRFVMESVNLVVDMGPNMEDVTQRPLWTHGTACVTYYSHHFVRALCSRYAETHEAKYADKAIQFVAAWLDQRPFVIIPEIGSRSYHITHQPDQEAMHLGHQMKHWIGLLYSGIAGNMTDELLFRVIRRMWFVMVQYRRFDTDTNSSGNHHMYERGIMPVVYGTMFPEFVSMKGFLDTGPAVVRRHCESAICRDGSSNEHSVCYGCLALSLFDNADSWGRLNGLDLFGVSERKKLKKAYLYMIQTIAPNGEIVPFGDGVRGGAEQVLPPAIASSLPEARGVCESLNIQPDFLSSLDKARYDAISPKLPSLVGIFEETGFLFARDGWNPRAVMLAMAIPHPEVFLHGQQDQLSVLVYVHGKTFLGHPAFESYLMLATPHWRRRIERSRFYNMTTQNCLLVHSHPVKPDEAFGAFGSPAPRCTLDEQRVGNNAFYARAYHEGYKFVRHTREAVLVNGRGVLINDTLTPIEHEDVEKSAYGPNGVPIARRELFHTQRWHLDYGVTAEKWDDASVILQNEGEHALLCWLPEEIEAVEIYPMWYVPPPLSRKGRPLVVDMIFGPSIEASVAMSIVPLPGGKVSEKTVTEARRELSHWRGQYCGRQEQSSRM